MANPLLQVSWEACVLEPIHDRAGTRRLKREAGDAPPWSKYFLTSPWFAKAAVKLGFNNGLLLKLDFDLALLVSLVVSQENSCRFCYATNRAMLRMLGLPEARVQALENQIATNGLDISSAAAVRFARAVNRGNGIDGPTERALMNSAGFDECEIAEVAYVATAMGFNNRMTTIAAISPVMLERAPDLWFVWLLRPLLTPLVRRMLKRGEPIVTASTHDSLPAALKTNFPGSPILPLLADTMSDLWRSPELSQRTKLLMFATIAQGIDCGVCAHEIDRLAVAENIDSAMLNTSAAHLDAPALSANERQYCEFARESLWYEPQIIQRRARALCASVGATAFVEALAVVSLGNMILRLTAALGEPVNNLQMNSNVTGS